MECSESVLRVSDLTKANERVPFRLLNLSLASLDVNMRPFCDSEGHSAVRLPGFLLILSGILSPFPFSFSNAFVFGQIVLSRPLPPLNASSLRLSLTLEQNSVWVGRICDKGRSQSAFLSDDFCSFSLCSLLPDACNSLEALASKFAESDFPLLLPLSDLFPTDQPIALVPMANFPLLEGYWKAQAQIQADDGNAMEEEEEEDEQNEQHILTHFGTENWHFVSLGNDLHEDL
ncbi:hypothetical protein niasHS_003749 [Heterodera schachtii]|uniref:Uncharacterized protein n=2 Tax=Heterodera TaxID=34509 RepID=A0ABD2KI71_HETSC